MAPSVTRPPLLLRIDEVADRLTVSRATTYRLIQRGLIPTVHIGTAVRVPEGTLSRSSGPSTSGGEAGARRPVFRAQARRLPSSSSQASASPWSVVVSTPRVSTFG